MKARFAGNRRSAELLGCVSITSGEPLGFEKRSTSASKPRPLRKLESTNGTSGLRRAD